MTRLPTRFERARSSTVSPSATSCSIRRRWSPASAANGSYTPLSARRARSSSVTAAIYNTRSVSGVPRPGLRPGPPTQIVGGAPVESRRIPRDHDAVAAPRLARAARALAQRVALEEHGVVLLENLRGLRLGDADGRAPVGEPVAVGAASVAAPAEDVHDVVALLQRVVAAQRQVAA